jgi:hypothetical protein
MSHGDLWAGIELKLDHARFHFERMDRALGPAQPLPQNPVLIASTGTSFDAFTWQREFCAHLGLIYILREAARQRRVAEAGPRLRRCLQPVVVIKGALHTAFVSAPSMMRFVPEMRLASGLARNTTPAVTSSAVPMRLVGFKDIAVL